MTEDHSDLNLCPNCGKENLPMATRCVHCGTEMEALFTIFGQESLSDEGSEDSLPDIIENIRNDPSLQVPVEPELNSESQSGDPDEKSAPDADQLPDWLAKVRERAQDEEDAIGDLVSGTLAMDAARSEEASAGVEGEFNAWIDRIRGKSQEQFSARVRQVAKEPEDPDEVPEWLQRIRALRPRSEDEITHEVKTNSSYKDELPLDWTEEALAELRRQALAEDSVSETEPLSTSSAIPEEQDLTEPPTSDEFSQINQEEPELVEDAFHNIPEDEDDYREQLPESDQTPSTEVEQDFEVEAPTVEVLETGEIDAPVEEPELPEAESQDEPVADIPELLDIKVDEVLAENSLADPVTNETVEPNEPEAAPIEAEAKQALEEPEVEPEEVETPPDSGAVPPDLLLLRDQQDRASLLASLIEQEGRVTAGKQAARKPSGRAGRLVVALLLLIGVIASILIGPAALPADTSRSVPALALDDEIQTLTKNDEVLVVLDYQAAASREIEAIAAPLLHQLYTQGTEITFVTTQPSGLFLARTLLAEAGPPEDTQVKYLPGSYLSLISLVANPAGSAKGADLMQGKTLADFRVVLLLSDSSDNVRGWLEQIAPWIDSLKFAAVTTQMEAPVLTTYFDSGQLVGYTAGINDGSFGTQPTFNYRAYRVGLLLMLVMLLLGMISKGEADAIRREEERAE